MVIFLLSDPSYPFLGFVRCASIIVQIRLIISYLFRWKQLRIRLTI